MKTKKLIKSMLPYIGSVLIMLGYLQLYIYYISFNIRINDYIDLTEIFTLTINNFIFYSIYFSILSFITFMIYKVENGNKIYVPESSYYDEKSFWKRILLFSKIFYLRTYGFLFLVIIFFIALFMVKSIINDFISFIIMSGCFILLFLIFLFFEFKYKYKLIVGKVLDYRINTIILFTVMIFAFVSLFTFLEVKLVYLQSNFKTISFEYEGEIVETNSNILYIGQSKNYLFMYNNSDLTSIVYKRDAIENFRIQELE
jgi:hypothetical protein